MAKDKLTDYSATNASNTDVGGINIDEGMQPSAVNDAIREVMTHLKEFSDGTSGVDVLNLQDDDASASIKIQAPAAVTTTTTFTLPDGDGTSGYALITNGSGQLSWAAAGGISNVVEDTTPQLGGNLDLNGNDITGTGNINNTGTITTDGLTVDGSSTLQNVTIGVDGTYAGNYRTIGFSGNTNGSTRIFGTTNDSDNLYIAAGTGRDINFWTGGSSATRMMIGANGRVGIGTSSPELLTHLKTSDNTIFQLESTTPTVYMKMVDSNTTGAGYIGYVTNDMTFWANNSERLRIDSSGNLLVSKTSANSTTDGIELRGGSGAVRFIGKTDSNAVGYLNRGVSDGDILQFAKDNGSVGSIGSRGTGTSYIILKSSAGAGAGLTGSDNAILPMDESALADANTSLGTGSYRFKDLYLSGNANVGDLIGPASANFDIRTGSGTGDMIFYTNGSERARIDASGNVGIGTSSPYSYGKLTVKAGNGTQLVLDNAGEQYTQMYFLNNGTDKGSIWTDNTLSLFSFTARAGMGMNFYTNNTERLRIDSSGNVGIGTSSPSSSTTHIAFRRSTFDRTQLVIGHSDTSNRTLVNFFGNGSQAGAINVSPTTTTYGTSSDYRLKENVTADWDATTRLKQLNPVRFNFIADPDTTVDGFLAHEVQDIVPEAITGTKDEVDEDGNAVMQGIDQSKLVPLLVKTIQELEARIAALEAN